MAVPRLRSVITRLQMARHEAWLEDLLEDSPPLIRMTMRPWRALLTPTPPPPLATLEIELDEQAEASVVARIWTEPTVEPEAEVRVSVARVSAGWLEDVSLEFVERVLDEA
jgi:hypothetical protein